MNHDHPEGRKTEFQTLQQIARSPAQEWFDIKRNTATVQICCDRVGAGLTRCGWDDYKWVIEHPSRCRSQELLARDGGKHPSREEHQLIAEWMLNYTMI